MIVEPFAALSAFVSLGPYVACLTCGLYIGQRWAGVSEARMKEMEETLSRLEKLVRDPAPCALHGPRKMGPSGGFVCRSCLDADPCALKEIQAILARDEDLTAEEKAEIDAEEPFEETKCSLIAGAKK